MKFTKWIYPVLLGFTMTAFAACSDDDNKGGGGNDKVALKAVNDVDKTGVAVKSTDTRATFSVYAPVKPTVTADQSWVSGESTEPSKMNSISQITLTIQPNTSTEARKANVTVTAGGSSLNVAVSQEGVYVEPEPEKPDWPGFTEEEQALLGLKAQDIAAQYVAGWNIGNTMEVPGGETGWGNPVINEDFIQGIKDAGFNMVRIPCAWDSHLSDRETNTINPTWLNRVNEVIGWITERGMYAVLNIHWDGGWLENNIGSAVDPVLLQRQSDYWTQIAKRLGHYNEMLMFAGLNEPNADGEAGMAALLAYEQAFIDAVRATGGNNATRTLVVQGPHTDINTTDELMNKLPNDPAGDGYLMAEIHYYDPYQYTIMEEDQSWGKVSWFWGADFHVAGSSRNATWGEEDWMLAQFEKMKKKFVDKGIPVIIGEYGAYPEEHYTAQQTDADKEQIVKSRAHFYSCVRIYAAETGLMPFTWDTGEIIERKDGSIKKQYMIDAIVGSAN